jgi:hypothetical protein
MLLRQVIKNLLKKTEMESRTLLEKMDSLPDNKLLFELEKLWTTLTAVKVSSNVIADELGLKPGSCKMVVCLSNNDRFVTELARHLPEKITTQGTDSESFYELLSFFKGNGVLGGVVLQRTGDDSLLEFAHFCTKIANYIKDDSKVFFYVVAPKHLHENFNPHFIPKDSVISSLSEITETI